MTQERIISIVLPVYNQADHIEQIVDEYEKLLTRIPNPHELILVVNGSRDNSLEVCQGLEKKYAGVRTLHSEQGGWGLGVKLGLQAAAGEIICYTNSARTNPQDLVLFLLYATVIEDVVIKANRKIRDNWQRRLGSLLYNLEVRALFDVPYWDINGTPKVFPRKFDKLLHLTCDDDLIDAEFNAVCREADYRVIEIPIFSTRRHGGKSTTRYGSALKMYLGAYQLWRARQKLARESGAVTTDRLDALRDARWQRHHAEWRDPMQVISLWEGASELDRDLLAFRARGAWWDVLERAQITLLVSREYEHLALALSVEAGRPAISYLKIPHPSGIAYDAARGVVHIACTRNPNQVLDFKPALGSMARTDSPPAEVDKRPLVPVQSRFYPGSLYMHDLALIGGTLHANSVGQNAVVRLGEDGTAERVWYPRCIERDGAPVFGQNHIQLNSIAAGDSLETSFFSASAEKLSARRPGHRNFPVDKRGVVFSGATREPIGRGLTRPHSARLHRVDGDDGKVWVDNSGYGELGYVENGGFTVVTRLPGWTRGLAFHGEVAFVGTSRVLPRFRHYAPGLEVDKSRCGLHAVDTQSGEILGSITWAAGNQIFAVEALPHSFTGGFPFLMGARQSQREKNLFYAFEV